MVHPAEKFQRRWYAQRRLAGQLEALELVASWENVVTNAFWMHR